MVVAVVTVAVAVVTLSYMLGMYNWNSQNRRKLLVIQVFAYYPVLLFTISITNLCLSISVRSGK